MPKLKQNQQMKVTLLIVGLFMAFIFFNLVASQPREDDRISFSAFLEDVRRPVDDINHIKKVTISEDKVSGLRSDGSSVVADAREVDVQLFLDSKVEVEYAKKEESSLLKTLLVNSLPMILLLFIFFFFMRQLQIGGGKAMSFGKSRAKLQNENDANVTFKSVAGVDEAKEELAEIVEFLKDPKKFTRLGGRIPKGVLLVGPPGTGKTMLAKAISGEAGVPFFSISGSDFVEMFVGVGASRVRDLFEQAKKNAPCIIFIDEIDAVGRQRGAGLGGGHDEREQTLNQLLVEMDGFESNEGVILIAATNRADVLDPALLRPGRFDRRVYVPKPDIKGRHGILKVHTRKTPIERDVDLRIIAQGTPGFSGADLQNLVNEAALIAARKDCKQIDMVHFELAKDKVMMGPERKSMIISEAEKRNTAYHESGHALVALNVKGADPVHKMTIIPRGQALGVTILLPEDDRLTMSKENAEGMIAYAMGGRAAEELIFGQTTTGAGNDIEKATEIARKMVCSWGMSDKIGPVNVGDSQGDPFLGRSMGGSSNNSQQVLQDIDMEVRTFVSTGYKLALDILTKNQPILESMAEALLIRESLGSEELADLLAGKNIITDQEKEEYQQRVKAQAEEMALKEDSDESGNNTSEDKPETLNVVPLGTS